MKTVILIHGLHMHSFHFYFMKKELKKDKNLDVRTFDYYSIFFNDNVLHDLQKLISTIPTENEIVIVAHSLGGLISRLYLNKFKPQKKIKLITLGTPHNGSLVAKNISKTILKPLLGKAVNAGLTNDIPAWDNSYPLISIAGVKKMGVVNIFAKNVIEDSDGTVFVSETRLNNAKEHIVLENMHHSELIMHKRAIAEVQKWL